MYKSQSKMLATILVLVWGTCGILAQGGMKLTVGQSGLNEAMTYYLDEQLVQYLHADLDIEDQIITVGPSSIHINKIVLEKLENQTATVEISSGNKITLIAGFSSLSMSANITLFGSDVIRANDTVVHFSECSLNVTFLLGTGNNAAGVVLTSCNATIGGFKAEGQLDQVLEVAFQLGQDYISSLVEEICPQLENITNESLKDILSVQDTVAISSSAVGDISINVKLLSITTEDAYITVDVEVALGTDPYVDDVTFPMYNFNMADTDVVLLVNDPLLSKIVLLAIQNTVLDRYLFSTTVQENTYKVQVNESSIQASVRSSEDGTSVLWNATFDVQSQNASNYCEPFRIWMESIIPFSISYNDTWVVASVDNERLQMTYKVSSWNATCLGSNIPMEELIDAQQTILNETNTRMEKQLQDKSFSMKLPTDKWFGFKEAHVNTLNGGLELAFGLRVGTQHNLPTEVLIIDHNKRYQGKLITYTFSNGQKVQVGSGMSTTAAPDVSTASLAVSGSNLILFLTIILSFCK